MTLRDDCPYGPGCELSQEPTFWGGMETVCLVHDSADNDDTDDTGDADDTGDTDDDH